MAPTKSFCRRYIYPKNLLIYVVKIITLNKLKSIEHGPSLVLPKCYHPYRNILHTTIHKDYTYITPTWLIKICLPRGEFVCVDKKFAGTKLECFLPLLKRTYDAELFQFYFARTNLPSGKRTRKREFTHL